MPVDPWDGIPCEWSEAPDGRALANAAHLVTAARAAGFPPEAAATGRWVSVCVFWDGGRTEVDVFDDRYELYVLPRSPDDGSFSVEDSPVDDPGTMATLLEKIKKARATQDR